MKISLLIYILLVINSCSKSPEESPQSFENNWETVDINAISEENLDSQFDNPLEYLRANRPNLDGKIDSIIEFKNDSSNKKRSVF